MRDSYAETVHTARSLVVSAQRKFNGKNSSDLRHIVRSFPPRKTTTRALERAASRPSTIEITHEPHQRRNFPTARKRAEQSIGKLRQFR
jgi:hypothetical protein